MRTNIVRDSSRNRMTKREKAVRAYKYQPAARLRRIVLRFALERRVF